MSTTKEQWQSSEKPRVLGASVFPCWAHLLCSPPSLGFLGLSYGRVCSQCGDQSSIPGWWGRSPGEGNGYSLQYSCLENSMDRGASWVTVHGVAESDTTKRLTGSVFSFTPSIPSIWYPLVTVNPAYFILQTPLSALPLALSQVRGGGHNFFLDNSESSPKQALVPLLQVLPTRPFDTWLPEPSCPTTFWLCFFPADNTS